MLVGIMSDSHGDASATARAVALLTERGALRLFHCGDLCGEAVLDELAGHDCTFVWGNCDSPSLATRRYVSALGLPWPQPPVRTEIAGRQIALFHGHERAFRAMPSQGGPDYVFHGHTHRCADRRENGYRLINPGALHDVNVRTVALLDVAVGDLVFLRIDTGQVVGRGEGAARPQSRRT